MTSLLRRFAIALAFLIASILPATAGAQCFIYLTQRGSFGNGNGQFNFAIGVATDAAGNVYVAERDNHRIQKFGPPSPAESICGLFGTHRPLQPNASRRTSPRDRTQCDSQ
jgi:hypothetical protein